MTATASQSISIVISPAELPPCMAMLVTTSSRQSSTAEARSAGHAAASARVLSQRASRPVSAGSGVRVRQAGMSPPTRRKSGRDGGSCGVAVLVDGNQGINPGRLQHALDPLARLQQNEFAALGPNRLCALKQEAD